MENAAWPVASSGADPSGPASVRNVTDPVATDPSAAVTAAVSGTSTPCGTGPPGPAAITAVAVVPAIAGVVAGMATRNVPKLWLGMASTSESSWEASWTVYRPSSMAVTAPVGPVTAYVTVTW